MLIFFFNDTATTEIYTLSLHDALPIYVADGDDEGHRDGDDDRRGDLPGDVDEVVRRQEGVGLETEEDEQHGEHGGYGQHPEVAVHEVLTGAAPVGPAGSRGDGLGAHGVTSPSSRSRDRRGRSRRASAAGG